jgi:hypothetical protein
MKRVDDYNKRNGNVNVKLGNNIHALTHKSINRTNGSRRKLRGNTKGINRWTTDGIKIGSLNIQGLTYFKLVMLL